VPIAPLFPFTTTSLCPLPARCRTTRYAPPFPVPDNGYSFRRCVRQEGGARGGRVGGGGGARPGSRTGLDISAVCRCTSAQGTLI